MAKENEKKNLISRESLRFFFALCCLSLGGDKKFAQNESKKKKFQLKLEWTLFAHNIKISPLPLKDPLLYLNLRFISFQILNLSPPQFLLKNTF